MTWFTKTKTSKSIFHSTLGKLSYCSLRGWKGNITSDGQNISILVAGSSAEPEPVLLRTMTSLTQKLDYFKVLAYSFIEQEVLNLPSGETSARLNVDELYELQVMYPNRGWLKSMTKTAPSVLATIMPDTPLSVLVFSIEADQNVLDVTFVSDTAVDIDYH